MARFPKPFFRESRQSWFVQLGKQQIKLHPDKEVAMTLYHQLMAERRKPEEQPQPSVPTAGHSASGREFTIVEILDKYLEWCQRNRSPQTFVWYQDHIQSFVFFLRDVAQQAVSQLKAFHLLEWVAGHPGWGDTYRRGAMIAICRPFNWAEKVGYIDRSPIRKVEKPKAQRREQAVTPPEFSKIAESYAEGDPFRDLLEFAWETGCRPQEAKELEARHVDLKHNRIVFPAKEAKGKKKARVIYLTSRAESIILARMQSKSSGLLFCNSKGNPWTNFSVNCRLVRLKKRLGVKYAIYSLRHGFCQRLLESGVGHAAVAALMGHVDATMVAKVYSHMDVADAHLRGVLLKNTDNEASGRGTDSA